MDQRSAAQYIYNLKRTLLFKTFIKQNNLDQNVIKDFVDSDKFKKGFVKIVADKKYDVRTIAELFGPMFSELGLDITEDFLKFTYRYSVNMSFPGTENIEDEMDKAPYANLMLRIYSYFGDIEKEYGSTMAWQKKYPMLFLTNEEEEQLEDDEYKRFKEFFKEDYVYEMVKLSQDIMGFTTLDHICGVHHLAIKLGRQLKQLGYEIDLGRVSGSAAGHDIGKYGCKPNERNRVAYYHYHYTGEWFKNKDIVYIRNIAINHSTWDLELENLPLEALILIYCDFRVKEDASRNMKFYPLDESFQVILDKLDNVDSAKELRYRKVYSKLKDFEDYMKFMGVQVDPNLPDAPIKSHEIRERYYSLLRGEEIVDHCKFASIEHNIKLLHRLRDEDSLNKILEKARDVENQIGKRGYINVLKEYSAYLTQKQKLIALDFLYDGLITAEDDIRKECANLIGYVIANYDEELRKEIPESVNVNEPELTGLGLLNIYVEKILMPDQKIIGKHRKWISGSLVHVMKEYFRTLKNKKVMENATSLLIGYFKTNLKHKEFDKLLIKASKGFIIEELLEGDLVELSNYLYYKFKHGNFEIRLLSLEAAERYLKTELPMEVKVKWKVALEEQGKKSMSQIETYLRLKALNALGFCEDYEKKEKAIITSIEDYSPVYLSNLKTVTLEIVKKTQIEILVKNNCVYNNGDGFYTALHLCNLLKVSSMEEVRTRAGEGLVTITAMLSFEQRNDIIVELLRALEMESYQVTRYIPDYLGRLLVHIKPKEFDELLRDFKGKIKRSNAQTGMLILKTVGQAILNYNGYEKLSKESSDKIDRRMETMLGILLNGFVSYIPSVNQTSFNVIGKYIFGSTNIDLEYKAKLFRLIGKKLLALTVTTDEKIDLVFFYNSAGLKHIYKFISEFNIELGNIDMESWRKIAFFPGAFDPFSLSHKQIAKEIMAMGYEVYLAVDEFSWSKRTHPNLRRRDIIKMSVADQLHIYTFPRDIIVNIGNPNDLSNLKQIFRNRDVYIVVGSDVIINASAYKGIVEENSIMTFPHVVFERPFEHRNEEDEGKFHTLFSKLPDISVKFKLSSKYENISSTQIRDYIDENRDISEMVDPLAQRYIYDKGLYQREPQFKEVMTTKSVTIEVITNPDAVLLEEVANLVGGDFAKVHRSLKELTQRDTYRLLIIRSVLNSRKIVGFSLFHWLRSSDIFKEFEDETFQNYIRENSVGRIFVIDAIYVGNDETFTNPNQVVLTETLSYGLSHDYSYCIYKDSIKGRIPTKLGNLLRYQGFLEIMGKDTSQKVYATNMTSPCTLNLDIKSSIKEPYRNAKRITDVVASTRAKLQIALSELYPGNLVISFDRTMLYENLIKKICDENDMPTTPIVPKTTGNAMCVPFGAIFKRWILPNTITKSIHAEKYFKSDLSYYKIEAYPYYLDLENQIKTIKSYDRPTMFVDDILHKGYRIRVLEPLIRKHEVNMKKVFVGILSGKGKALMEKSDIDVDSAYFIPRLKVWFNEGKIYPIIGGDSTLTDSSNSRNLIPSINLMLPYSYPSYIKGTDKMAVYNLSEVCLNNSLEILLALEEEYQSQNGRMLTMAQLGEVLVTPRYPDRGESTFIDLNAKASDLLIRDLEHLGRLKSMFR